MAQTNQQKKNAYEENRAYTIVCMSVRLLISLYGSTLFNCTGSFIFRAAFVEKFIVK